MPKYVVDRLTDALNDRFSKSLKGSRIVLVGFAYKKDVGDERESPAFKLTELLEDRGAETSYYDPFVPVIPRTREHASYAGRCSLEWQNVVDGDFDAALVCTDHSDVDYDALVSAMPLVIDTRNVVQDGDKVVRA